MNTLITKIALQADQWCDEHYTGNEYYNLFWEGKFAQLIVEECAKACLEEGEKFRGQQDISDFKLCALVIKERFEVE